MTRRRYKWATEGDINAFFALFLDNVVNLFILTSILTTFGMPRDFVYTRILPGTAAAVMVGDLLFTWLAFRLARRTGRSDVTAMPLGLDLPTTVGVAIAIIVPSFHVLMDRMDDVNQAARAAWLIGVGATLWMGTMKLAAAFFAPHVQRFLPTAGLVGSLAGVGLVWLGAHALFGIYEIPFVGLIALVIIIFTLISGFPFPFRIPGAAAAVLVGTAVYYIFGLTGVLDGIGLTFSMPGLGGFGFYPPLPQLSGVQAMFGGSLDYLAVAVPFAILVITGSINVMEAARLAGDDYNTRSIILADSVATLIGGLCGGVAQTGPYFGHSAYRKMGAHAAYTAAAAVAIGLGGMFGFIGFLVDLIPDAVVKPILILVGFDMVRLVFQMTPRRHVMAVILAMTPSVLNYCYTNLKIVFSELQASTRGLKAEMGSMRDSLVGPIDGWIARLDHLLPEWWIQEYIRFGVLGQGFILTAMIWGTATAWIIDRHPVRAATALFLAAVFSLFGVIHSVYPSGRLYLPWNLEISVESGLVERSLSLPYELAAGYVLAGVTILFMFFAGPAHRMGPAEEEPD